MGHYNLLQEKIPNDNLMMHNTVDNIFLDADFCIQIKSSLRFLTNSTQSIIDQSELANHMKHSYKYCSVTSDGHTYEIYQIDHLCNE